MDAVAVVDLAHERAASCARVVSFVTYILVFIGVVVMVLVLEGGASKQDLAWSVATVFVVATLPLTARDINSHILHFEFPEMQKFIVRILFMVPIYSVTSWICLASEDYYVYFEAFRSLYEGYVIWSFLYFLMTYLAPSEEELALHLASKPQEQHLFPFNYLIKPWTMGHEFLIKCKTGCLQYVFWKIINVIIVFISSWGGFYHDGEFRLDGAYFYVMMITNVSQLVAIYCLVLFYHANQEDLAPINPLPKFLCIKLVVFFVFWQGVLVAGLVYFEVIQSTDYFATDRLAKGLQDFVVCVEMFLFAIAHHFFFSYDDFKRYGVGLIDSSLSNTRADSITRSSFVQALLEAANPRDLVHDISRDLRRFQRTRSRSSGQPGAFSSSIYDDSSRIIIDQGVDNESLSPLSPEFYRNNESALNHQEEAQQCLIDGQNSHQNQHVF